MRQFNSEQFNQSSRNRGICRWDIADVSMATIVARTVLIGSRRAGLPFEGACSAQQIWHPDSDIDQQRILR
jgi:hypothetical protein